MNELPTRRGFLQGGVLASLALAVLPEFGVPPSVVGQRVIWTPEGPLESTGGLEVIVRRMGAPDPAIIWFTFAELGGLRWKVPPGDGLIDRDGELIEIGVYTERIVKNRPITNWARTRSGRSIL